MSRNLIKEFEDLCPKSLSWFISHDPPTTGFKYELRIWKKLDKPIKVDGRWTVSKVKIYLGNTIQEIIKQVDFRELRCL